MQYIISSSNTLHAWVCFTDSSLAKMLRNISEMCHIYDVTSVWQFLPDVTISRQENCMRHAQALSNFNTTRVWFGRNRYFNGGNEDMSKHAPKTQTEYTGSQAGSVMAQRRDLQMRSFWTAWGERLCHCAPPGTFPGHKECWKVTSQNAGGLPWIMGLIFWGLVYAVLHRPARACTAPSPTYTLCDIHVTNHTHTHALHIYM